MKKYILFTTLCFITLNLSSQSPNFFVDGAVWTYHTSESIEMGSYFSSYFIEKDSIQGDTLITGIVYKRLFVQKQQTISNSGNVTTYPIVHSKKYIRYDSLFKSVFMINDTGTFVPEIKLYDFNLLATDTTPLAPYEFILVSNVIDSLENIVFFGEPTLKYFLQGSTENYIVKGMGGSNGLTYYKPVQNIVSGGIFMTTLQCFQLGDSLYNPTGQGCPSFVTVGSSENTKPEIDIVIYPNPTIGNFTIVTPTYNSTITITDILGQQILKSQVVGKTTQLELENNGIYIIQIDSKQGISTGKILVNK